MVTEGGFLSSSSSLKSKLLIIDDSAINLDLLVSSLGDMYDLRTAIDGKIALTLIAEGFCPDLILLDIMMPGMDGYEVCRRLKSDKSTQYIPIIFLTSLSNEEDEEKGLNLGVADYITKPFKPAILKLRIRTQLELKQHRDQLQKLVDKKISELTSIQKKKQKTEALLQSVLISAPVAIGFIVKQRIVWANQKTADITGYTCTELEGQPFRVLYPSDVANDEFSQRCSVVQESGTSSFDTTWRTKRGIAIDVHVNTAAVDQMNFAAGIIFVALDITARKQAEEALLLSENKFSRLFKLSPDAISLTRVTDGTCIDINQGFSKILGWQEEEVIGRSLLDFGIWCRDGDWDRVVSDLGTHGEVNDLEVFFQRKEGNLIVGLYSARLIQISGDDCILSIMRDITEQKKSENEIIKSKEEWETTFDAMSDMVSIFDRNMRIVRANKATHDFFGADYGQLTGQTCCDVFWASSEACLGCSLPKAIKNGEKQTEIISYTISDKALLVTTSPIPNESGQAEYYVHIARDISEQRQLEKKASRASRLASLGELAAGVAHEINNPNALILYNSDILDPIVRDILRYFKENPPADSGQLFGGLPYRDVTQEVPILFPAIHDSAQRIKRIVNDLRDFSCQDSSYIDEAVDLNRVVQAAVRLVNNTIKKATNHFTLNLAETLPAFMGISGRLDQVIINLLLNACQALENCSQKISLTTVYDADIDQILVIVTDEGQGMSVEDMEHILEPFVTTKRDQGGTGLGLSVSARIVKEHHGTLKFASVLGQGTTATISLPTCKEDNHVS